MVFETPSWAARHNYFHHSNPRSGDRAKKLFEKSHIRPQIKWARYVIKDETREAEHEKAAEILKNFTVGRGSAAMEAGRAVQDACDLHLIPDKEFQQTLSLAEAIEVAVNRMQKYKPKDWSPAVFEDDTARKEKYIEEMPSVVENAVLGLQEAMQYDNRIIGEIDLLDKLPGNALPHNTLPDYGRRGDLKTKWSYPSTRANAKPGTWDTRGLPKKLTNMFDMANVYQVAGFYALNGRLPPFLVYANKDGYRVFHEHNCDELKPDFLDDVVRDISMQHKITENILKAASNKHDLLNLVSPDFSLIQWNEPPAYLDEAKKMWGLTV